MAEIARQTEQVAVESCHLQEGQTERCNVVEDSAGEIPVAANTIHLMVKSFEILAAIVESSGSTAIKMRCMKGQK
jgi:hypothetical protein